MFSTIEEDFKKNKNGVLDLINILLSISHRYIQVTVKQVKRFQTGPENKRESLE